MRIASGQDEAALPASGARGQGGSSEAPRSGYDNKKAKGKTMKKNIWLTGISAGAALAAAAFMPSKASATNNCCQSSWSPSVSDSHHGPEYCNITKGYITNGIQYNMWTNVDVVREAGIDSILASVYTNSYGTGMSPGARVKGVCKNQTQVQTRAMAWSTDSYPATYLDCASGVTWAQCQSQIANGDPHSGCTNACL
jgi:hypothetical protein